jgi:hypothetical protein
MNKEALSKRMSKLGIDDKPDVTESLDTINMELLNIKDKKDRKDTKIVPKKELVKFTHGVYGTITSGGYKGYEVEIREYIPEKILVKLKDGSKVYLASTNIKVNNKKTGSITIKKGKMKGQNGVIIRKIKSSVKVLVNSKPEIIDVDNIFYHDISLEGNIICNVLKIERDGNSYKFYVKTLKNDKMIISQKDIKLYLLGFRINRGLDMENIEEKVEDEISFSVDEDIEESDVDSDTESSIDYGDEPEADYTASYKDTERVGKIMEELKGKKKEDYNLIKTILELNNENESSINIYEMLDDISNILKYISNKIDEKGVNFNIYKSIIDKKMIIILLTAYEMISSEGVNFRGLDTYINVLYEHDFFQKSKINDSILLQNDIFKCKLIGGNSEIDNIKTLIRCLDKIIQKRLKKDINLEVGEEVIETSEFIPIVPKLKMYKKFKTVEELLENNEMILFSDLISGKEILLGSKVEKCVNVYKDNLKDYIENQQMTGLQKMLYNFVYDNFTNIDKLNELKSQVISILSNKFDDFMKTYEDCDTNKEYFNVEMCRENVIISYISDYTNDKKGKSKMDDFKTLLKYKEFIRLSKEFIVFLKSCYLESKIYKGEKEKIIKEKLESIKRKRDLEYEYDERTKEWIKKKKENLIF